VAVGIVVCVGLFAALVIPARLAAREAARRAVCTDNLKRIGQAMHQYHDTYKCFPAAVLTDEAGNPMRSWRIALLPFLENSTVCDQYDFNEPWDSPGNQVCDCVRPQAFACPSDIQAGPFDTSYVMIVGEGTAGGVPNEKLCMADIRDGVSCTIFAIEVTGSGIPWLEPRDITMDEAIAYIANPAAHKLPHAHPGGVNVLTFDGSVHFLASATDPEVLKALMTRNGGESFQF
jgi:prepilin-type processing-associated H-X9-DG protein